MSKHGQPESRLLDSASRNVIVPGRCRICGCTEERPCIDPETQMPCGWLDREHTLCDNINCIARVPMSEIETMIPDDALVAGWLANRRQP